jgi:flagellar protein FliS
MTKPALRARYLAEAVATASPGQLLVMLYDRLVVDLVHAEQALAAGDREASSERLLHAQDIIVELSATLDVAAWDGAAGLIQLYGFVLVELIKANVHRDLERVIACRGLIEPLRDSWREALSATQYAGVAAAQAG